MNTEIGVVLSGGGIRAAAHIGVLQALNANGIFPSVISAASGGAIVGALYCGATNHEKYLNYVRNMIF